MKALCILSFSFLIFFSSCQEWDLSNCANYYSKFEANAEYDSSLINKTWGILPIDSIDTQERVGSLDFWFFSKKRKRLLTCSRLNSSYFPYRLGSVDWKNDVRVSGGGGWKTFNGRIYFGGCSTGSGRMGISDYAYTIKPYKGREQGVPKGLYDTLIIEGRGVLPPNNSLYLVCYHLYEDFVK